MYVWTIIGLHVVHARVYDGGLHNILWVYMRPRVRTRQSRMAGHLLLLCCLATWLAQTRPLDPNRRE
jgi:hypothetical protein